MSKINKLIGLLQDIEELKASMTLDEYKQTFFMLGSQTRLNLTSEDIERAIKRLMETELRNNETHRN